MTSNILISLNYDKKISKLILLYNFILDIYNNLIKYKYL